MSYRDSKFGKVKVAEVSSSLLTNHGDALRRRHAPTMDKEDDIEDYALSFTEREPAEEGRRSCGNGYEKMMPR